LKGDPISGQKILPMSNRRLARPFEGFVKGLKTFLKSRFHVRNPTNIFLYQQITPNKSKG